MRTLLPVVAVPLFVAACGGGYVTPPTPTPPPPTPSTTLPPSNRAATNWRADAVVTAVKATEQVFWGTVEAETTVTRRWSGRAMP